MKRKGAIDLHIHSTSSDGSDSPEKLINKAYQRGITMMSITDHDDIGALKIAKEQAQKFEITFINGVELSVQYKHPLYKGGKKSIELHLLGYSFDSSDPTLNNVIEENRIYREYRAKEIIKKLNKALLKEGKPKITSKEFRDLQKSIEGSIGRPHLASLLLKKEIVKTIDEAFDKYLHVCDVEKRSLELEEASRLIKKAGGKVILAHPVGTDNFSLRKFAKTPGQMEQAIDDLTEYIDGLECYYWYHTKYTTQFLVEIANKNKLIITGGTDHHGGDRDLLGRLSVPQYVGDYFM